MGNRFDDSLFIEMERETKDKLGRLAAFSERSMAAWIRHQINIEFDKLPESVKAELSILQPVSAS